ncbi:amidase family protein [Thiohalocapsa sp. ML1]|jgi:amidase|uniref:amidase family protein n=1 Tax=Thiohalocapsa sp. ML1 TaxID=1431688 RepID=UPI0007322917|nr:amidase family protein [Thiohalocapsa sp. ML1]
MNNTKQGAVHLRLLVVSCLAICLAICLGAAVARADALPPSDAPFELIEADLADVQTAFAAGTLTAEALTRAYLERIKTLDRRGPRLNTLIAVNEQAAADAAALDAERAESGPRGPLHGIPVIIRDNLSTLDLPTTAGAAALRGHEPLRDAFVVQRLREAGAVILAKANMSELTLPLGRFSYSSAAGQSRNPYNLRRAPSSAADAAALAANLGMLAVGTDTAGSLRGPAAVSAVVGLKPTLGLTSRSGLLPTALSIEVTGPLARSVRDAALLLNVIAAEDPSDPRTADPPDRPADYTAGLAEATLDGVRLGVARAYGGAHKEVDAAFTAALDLLRAQGAELLDVKLPDVVLDGWELVLERLIETEFRDQVNAYLLHTEQGMPHSLAELLRMSASPLIAGSPTPTPPGRLDAYRRALRSPGLADLDYLDILSRRLPAARTAVTALFTEHELDALVLPTMLCPASSLLLDYDESYHCAADRDPYQPAYLASIAGLPELTLPMGFTEEGLPLGVSLVGPAFSEARLLALGHAFEQVAKVRRAPEIPDAPPPVLETLPEED